MTIKLNVLDGGLRVRLSEDQWRALYEATDLPEGRNALEPLDIPAQETDKETFADGVLSASRLALGGSPVNIDVTTMAKDRGLVATLGTDGSSAAGAVRVIAGSETDGAPATPVPGVELSAVHAKDLIGELMRLFPPDVRTEAPAESAPVTLPQEQALVLAKAVRDGDDKLAREVASQSGWTEVPDVLIALAHDVRANATIALQVTGSTSMVVRQWLQCDLGWVSLAILDGQITHTLCSRQQIKDDLVYTLAGAFEFALTSAVSHG